MQPEDRHGLRDRTVHDGSVLEALEESEIAALKGGLADVESVAVCLLHTYANRAHERRLGQALCGALPRQLSVSSSGTMSNVSFGGRLPEQGWPFSYYETIAGGMGAWPRAAGLSAVHSHMTNNVNMPAESLERGIPCGSGATRSAAEPAAWACTGVDTA
ncbi:MAG: hydantoinase B/oxoprolinase family protein [Bryobacterales bacterium]|nr:hydantoinase B/oxoprolinase family protein [Bryobacterales bacterium]